MNINNFRDDLTDTSAKKEALITTEVNTSTVNASTTCDGFCCVHAEVIAPTTSPTDVEIINWIKS